MFLQPFHGLQVALGAIGINEKIGCQPSSFGWGKPALEEDLGTFGRRLHDNHVRTRGHGNARQEEGAARHSCPAPKHRQEPIAKLDVVKALDDAPWRSFPWINDQEDR